MKIHFAYYHNAFIERLHIRFRGESGKGRGGIRTYCHKQCQSKCRRLLKKRRESRCPACCPLSQHLAKTRLGFLRIFCVFTPPLARKFSTTLYFSIVRSKSELEKGFLVGKPNSTDLAAVYFSLPAQTCDIVTRVAERLASYLRGQIFPIFKI